MDFSRHYDAFDDSYDHDRFIKYYLADLPQIFVAKRSTDFGKINTKMAKDYFNYRNIKCPFCNAKLCSIDFQEKDRFTKNYNTKVRGYKQLCDECGRDLCRNYGKKYQTFCHHHSRDSSHNHRSGIYVKRDEIYQIKESSSPDNRVLILEHR